MTSPASPDRAPVWLITGCSSGFGRELTSQAISAGLRVVATARKREAVEDLLAGVADGQAAVLPLDVTDRIQIAAVVEQTVERFGTIDVLVNNAGFGYFGGIEEAAEEDVRGLFETNFFGLAAVTRAVLPHMRRQRAGVIVNISSIGGLIAYPGVGYYNATKFAVEGFSEALSKEVLPLGIHVVIVEPGPFRTQWAGRSAQHSVRVIEDYAATVGVNRRVNAASSGTEPGDPARAARAIIDAATAAQPPSRLLLGRWAFDAALGKLDELRIEFESHRDLTLGADFDS